MTPKEHYRQGDVRGAIQTLGDEVRKNPLDASRRTFLFELLLFAGEFDRAEKQLDVLAGLTKECAAGALMYRSALHAERTRQGMFACGDLPRAAANVEISGGCWNGTDVTELSDADPRIGANLEVFVAGSYTWIPMQYIRRIEMDAPQTLRDLVWARAKVETSPEFRLQDLGEVLLPVISPLSFRHADAAVRLGREAAWEEDETHGVVPFGAKLMSVDGVDIPLVELRSLRWMTQMKELTHAGS